MVILKAYHGCNSLGNFSTDGAYIYYSRKECDSMKTLISWAIGVIFLYVLSFLFSGVVIDNILAAIVAAVLIGLVNITIKPMLQVISIPITILTLGLFYLVVNALLLLLVSALVPGFSIGGFWTAFFASIVLSILNAAFTKKGNNWKGN